MKNNTSLGTRHKRAHQTAKPKSRSALAARTALPDTTPAFLVGETIAFKFEGNLRARVIGYETVNGQMWPSTEGHFTFLIPPSLILGVEKKG